MSILKENKGVIIFYIVLAITTLILVNDVKMENLNGGSELFTYIKK